MVEERLVLLECHMHVMRTPNEWLVSSRLIMLDPTARFSTQIRMAAAKSMESLSTRMCGDEQSDQRLLYEQMGIARIC